MSAGSEALWKVVSYDECDTLPIHAPNAIQGQGWLLAFDLIARRASHLSSNLIDPIAETLSPLAVFRSTIDEVERAPSPMRQNSPIPTVVQERFWPDYRFRLGGDEFVILLPDLTRAVVSQLADGIVAAFRGPRVLSGSSYVVNTSVGAVADADGQVEQSGAAGVGGHDHLGRFHRDGVDRVPGHAQLAGHCRYCGTVDYQPLRRIDSIRIHDDGINCIHRDGQHPHLHSISGCA